MVQHTAGLMFRLNGDVDLLIIRLCLHICHFSFDVDVLPRTVGRDVSETHLGVGWQFQCVFLFRYRIGIVQVCPENLVYHEIVAQHHLVRMVA